MKEKKNFLFNKALSLLMAVVMLVSVITVMPGEVKAAEYSFKGNGTSVVTITDQDCINAITAREFHWIKFQPKKTGSITITATNASGVMGYTEGFVVLCDASKNIIDYTEDYYNTSKDDSRYFTITYGVKANTTYYFRVDAGAGVSLKATVSSIKKAANKNRKKAKTIAHNKNVKGVIIAGDKRVDWYKINLKKSKKIKVTFNVKTNGWNGQNANNMTEGIRFTFCDSKGRMFTRDSYDNLNRSQNKGTVTYYMTRTGSSKKLGLKPGTYYIKVERVNTFSSGEYSLKWKMS